MATQPSPGQNQPKVIIRNLPPNVYELEENFQIGLKIALKNSKNDFQYESINNFVFIRGTKGKPSNKLAKKLFIPSRVYLSFRNPTNAILFCAIVDGLEFPDNVAPFKNNNISISTTNPTTTTDNIVITSIEEYIKYYPCTCERINRGGKVDDVMYGKPDTLKGKIESDPQFNGYISNLKNPIIIPASTSTPTQDTSKTTKRPALAEYLAKLEKLSLEKQKEIKKKKTGLGLGSKLKDRSKLKKDKDQNKKSKNEAKEKKSKGKNKNYSLFSTVLESSVENDQSKSETKSKPKPKRQNNQAKDPSKKKPNSSSNSNSNAHTNATYPSRTSSATWSILINDNKIICPQNIFWHKSTQDSELASKWFK